MFLLTLVYTMDLKQIAWWLLVIGGINWLLVGLLGWDLGQLIFGSMSHIASKVIYIAVGAAAVYSLVTKWM